LNGMNISISLQALRFLLSCGVGIFLALFYDLMRILRYSFHCSRWITNLTDLFFSFCALTAFALFVLGVCQGDIRSFLVVGLTLGMLLYFLTVSRFILHAGKQLANGVLWICSVLWYPFAALHKKLCQHRQKRRQEHGSHEQKEKSG